MDKQLVRGYEVEQCYIGALGSVTDEVRCLQERCYSKRSSPFVCLFVCYVHCLLACYKVLVLLPVEKGVLLKEIVYLQIVFSWIILYLSVFSQWRLKFVVYFRSRTKNKFPAVSWLEGNQLCSLKRTCCWWICKCSRYNGRKQFDKTESVTLFLSLKEFETEGICKCWWKPLIL